MAHHYLMVVLFIRYMRPKIQLCGTLLFLEQLMFYNYGMRYRKGKFHCASGRLNSLLCPVAASSFIKFLATDWLFPDKYGDASSCDSMHFSAVGRPWGHPWARQHENFIAVWKYLEILHFVT